MDARVTGAAQLCTPGMSIRYIHSLLPTLLAADVVRKVGHCFAYRQSEYESFLVEVLPRLGPPCRALEKLHELGLANGGWRSLDGTEAT